MNKIKHLFQRLIRGFDDYEIGDLDSAFKQWLAPRLELYIKKYGKYKSKLQIKRLKEILWWVKDFDKEYDDSLDNFLGNIDKDKFKNLKKKFIDTKKREEKAKQYFIKYIDEMWI